MNLYQLVIKNQLIQTVLSPCANACMYIYINQILIKILNTYLYSKISESLKIQNLEYHACTWSWRKLAFYWLENKEIVCTNYMRSCFSCLLSCC